MKIEHFAWNSIHAQAIAHWYHEYCGMPIWVERHEPVYVAFLGEPPCLIEIYDNPKAPCIDFEQMEALTFHLALYSEDLQADQDRLLAAGASFMEGEIDPQGYGLLMLRDPWGMPLQLCKRETPLISH